jgi:hypothetical protein
VIDQKVANLQLQAIDFGAPYPLKLEIKKFSLKKKQKNFYRADF